MNQENQVSSNVIVPCYVDSVSIHVNSPQALLTFFLSVIGFIDLIFEVTGKAINISAGFILIIACFVALANFSCLLLFESNCLLIGRGTASLKSIRLSLGKMILFALELLISADVIETLTKSVDEMKLEVLYKIGITVIIRTILEYFLGNEVKELEHELKHSNNVENANKSTPENIVKVNHESEVKELESTTENK